MKLPIYKITMTIFILVTAWNCSQSTANQESASKSSAENIHIPQNIVVSETSYFYQAGPKYYIIAPKTLTVSDGTGNVVGTFNLSTGAIMSLSGEIIAINLDLSKLPVIAPVNPSKSLFAVDLDI